MGSLFPNTCRNMLEARDADNKQGKKFPAERIKAAEEKSALKLIVRRAQARWFMFAGETPELILRQTDLDDCADAYIMLAKNTSMTGMKVQVGELPRSV